MFLISLLTEVTFKFVSGRLADIEEILLLLWNSSDLPVVIQPSKSDKSIMEAQRENTTYR